MRRVLDIIITAFFKILVPIVYVAFIFAGIGSALVSGLIEYEVFAELFPKNIKESSNFYLSIPFLIVVAFEITKIFLIFLNKTYTESQNTAYLKSKRMFFGLRIALITISIVATLLFSFYNLHNPEYDNLLAKTKTEIEEDFMNQINRLNTSFDNQIDRQITPLNEDIQSYEGKMKTEENFKFKGRQEYRGPRYEEAKRLRTETENRRQQIIIELNKQRNQRISELNKLKNNKIEQQKSELKTSTSSGNKMLSATLQVINMEVEFPQIQYILVIGVLSLLLSFGLEYIIWASFTVLAINHGDYFEVDMQAKNLKSKHKVVNNSMEDMSQEEAKSFERSANKWLSSFKNDAREKSRQYMNQIKNVFK